MFKVNNDNQSKQPNLAQEQQEWENATPDPNKNRYAHLAKQPAQTSEVPQQKAKDVDHEIIRNIQYPLTPAESLHPLEVLGKQVPEQSVVDENFQHSMAAAMHLPEFNLLKTQQEVLLNTASKAGLAHEDISDGYHTFKELYDLRKVLVVNWFYTMYDMASHNKQTTPVWRSKLHSDKTMYDNHFIVGLGFKEGHQISFHFHTDDWELFYFCRTLDKAPQFDGHTTQDVIKRMTHFII